MHVDSYKFGRIVIDGETYNSDVIIFADSVQSKWWRRQGHSLSPADLDAVIEAKPSVLVIGCGSPGLMKVPDQTKQYLRDRDIQLEVFDSKKAAERFNELSEEGSNIVAALHPHVGLDNTSVTRDFP